MDEAAGIMDAELKSSHPAKHRRNVPVINTLGKVSITFRTSHRDVKRKEVEELPDERRKKSREDRKSPQHGQSGISGIWDSQAGSPPSVENAARKAEAHVLDKMQEVFNREVDL